MRPIKVRCAFNCVHMWSVYFYNSSSMASICAFVCKICINVCVSVYISLHISISSEVVLHPSSTAHIYAKPGSCQSVAPVTRGSTSPIKPDRAGCVNHAQGIRSAVYCQIPSMSVRPRETPGEVEGERDLIRINYASPCRLFF